MRAKPATNFNARYWSLLVFAVLAAYGPVILIRQPLWDDWVLRAYSDAGTLWELAKQAGNREVFPLLALFASISDPRIVIATELLLFCARAPLIYTIIRRTTRWPAPDAFWAALLTALVPLNQARFVLSTLYYAFSCVFFASAIVLLLHDLNKPSVSRRLLIVLLLAMAFSTSSFLVLAWLAPAIVAIDAWRNAEFSSSAIERFHAAIRAVVSRAELVLLPPTYWVAKKIFSPTYGLYASYNQFQLDLPTALKQTVITLVGQFNARDLFPARSELAELGIAAGGAIALFAGVAWLWRLPLKTTDECADDSRLFANRLTVAVAMALVFSALFPYVLVGKPPRFAGLWETRHQTTLMMVSGFALFSLLRLILPRVSLSKLAAAIAAGFLVIDISFTHKFIADSLETRALSGLFSQDPSPPGTMMLVVENDRDYRALGRFFPFYELSYLINGGKNGEPRLAISSREIIDPATKNYAQAPVPAVIAALTALCTKYRSSPQYGFGGFVANGQIETVRLVANRPPPGLFQTISEAVHTGGGVEPQQASAMVRLEREIGPIGGACVGPCCTNE